MWVALSHAVATSACALVSSCGTSARKRSREWQKFRRRPAAYAAVAAMTGSTCSQIEAGGSILTTRRPANDTRDRLKSGVWIQSRPFKGDPEPKQGVG
jgi:hypothetical protein